MSYEDILTRIQELEKQPQLTDEQLKELNYLISLAEKLQGEG